MLPLILGTTGKPSYQSAFLPQVKNTIERQPSPTEIIDAVRQHQRTLRNLSSIKTDDEDWVFEKIPNLDRVAFIDEEPTDVWLATCIYVPDNLSSANIWSVCDPFGLGDSPWLLRKLEKYRREGVIQGLEKILINMLGDQRSVEFDNLEDWLSLADREARLVVENKLSPVIRKWEELFEDLVALERIMLEAQEVKENHSRILTDKLTNALGFAQIAAERIFKILKVEYPTQKHWKRLSDRTDLNHDPLNQFAESVQIFV